MKKHLKKISSLKQVRFIIIGVINTSLDFGLLFVFKSLGLPTIPSNILSTTIAFLFSFTVNRKYTFKSTSDNVKKELLLFTTVTLFGLWVVQSIIIALTLPFFRSIFDREEVATLIAKLAASVFTIIWNYFMYDKVVFKKKPVDK